MKYGVVTLDQVAAGGGRLDAGWCLAFAQHQQTVERLLATHSHEELRAMAVATVPCQTAWNVIARGDNGRKRVKPADLDKAQWTGQELALYIVLATLDDDAIRSARERVAAAQAELARHEAARQSALAKLGLGPGTTPGTP